ncbi:hypothetical protein F3U02_22365 [Shigella flexneri]|nr:hypothetical protein [Salmonella enterica subsp. enterica]ECF2591714.1 hypothetical protein [Salmonella enterica subsp. enterica serovar Typhimurium]EFE7197833.1 hypothetical protein [Escherichia coli]EFV9212317.1 hypothetical protein [Shigella sonnei]EFW1243706.1 hypothetical protein [Shigella flexneri]HBZ2148564.1 hypothetical protein [Klebsiella pneumoniae]
MWLKFTGCDRGSFSGGLLPFLPVCCRDRAERVSAVRTISDYGKSPFQAFSPSSGFFPFRNLRARRMRLAW